LREERSSNATAVSNFLDSALRALPRRYTNEILSNSLDGEAFTYDFFEDGVWSSESFRDSHGILAFISAIGYAENGNIVAALKILDKSMLSGFPFNDVQSLYSLIRIHTQNCESLYCVKFRKTYLNNL
jgi:hypothetical protein